jgi:hypothetical protein
MSFFVVTITIRIEIIKPPELSAEEKDIVQDTVNRWNMMCEQRNMTNQPCIQYIEESYDTSDSDSH